MNLYQFLAAPMVAASLSLVPRYNPRTYQLSTWLSLASPSPIFYCPLACSKLCRFQPPPNIRFWAAFYNSHGAEAVESEKFEPGGQFQV